MLNPFKTNHSRTKRGRFVVPLPKQCNAKFIGESRSQAIRRFLSLERSLNSKNQFKNFESLMREYVDLGHTELIPSADAEKPEPKSCTYRCTQFTRAQTPPQR